MSDYPRRATRPLPREELAPIGPAPVPDDDTRPAIAEAAAFARAAEDGIVTQTRCPLCCGLGMVAPEIAATFEGMCTDARNRT